MGFFDTIFPQPDSGGLLDFLRRNAAAAIQNSPGGLQSDMAQYGSPAAAAVAGAVRQAPDALTSPMQPQPVPQPQAPLAQPAPGAPAAPMTPAMAPDPIAALMTPPEPQRSSFTSALQTISKGGTLLGALSGLPDDPQSIAQRQAQQTVRARYYALQQAGIPKEKALLAAIDPEGAGKTIVSEALGSDKYTFSTLPDGTMVRQNARTGAVEPAYQGTPKADFGIVGENDGQKTYGFIDKNRRSVQPLQAGDDRDGTITGPDGKPIAIPPGVDRQSFIKEVTKANADAAVGKMTETQAKAGGFAAKMEQAEQSLQKLQDQGTSYYGKTLDSLPLVGGSAATNALQSANYQQYRQAASAFITALLRQESGAAISKDEFARYEREMMPQPGDSKATLRQKAVARSNAIAAMKRAAGPGYKSPTPNEPAAPMTTRTGVKWSIE